MTNSDQQTAEAVAAASFDQTSARSFCGDLATTVDALIEVLSEETRLIRAARLTDAAAVSSEKAVVSGRYMKAHRILKASGTEIGLLAPDEVGHLRARHQELESAISLNLAVLATARTVSETLIRDIADTVSRRDGSTSTYGANAQQVTQAPRAGPLSYNGAL